MMMMIWSLLFWISNHCKTKTKEEDEQEVAAEEEVVVVVVVVVVVFEVKWLVVEGVFPFPWRTIFLKMMMT
jgi:hypothetical protein